MNLIYLYEGAFKHGEAGYDLVKRAASYYAFEKGIEFSEEEVKIVKEEKGKPYFVDIPIEFSLTHSGKMWMCMFGKEPCGLDLQIERECDYEKLSKRWYTSEEQHYVDLWGQSGFFDVWVRKEAFVKLTGQGLFTDMPSVVTKNADLADKVVWKDKVYYFKSIEIDDEIKCAYCTNTETEVEMRFVG